MSLIGKGLADLEALGNINSGLFDQIYGPSIPRRPHWDYRVTANIDTGYDVEDTLENMIVRIKVTGMTKENIVVTIEDKMLHIDAKPTTETKLIKPVSFSWPLSIGTSPDRAVAIVENGLLTVRFSKILPEKKTTVIVVF